MIAASPQAPRPHTRFAVPVGLEAALPPERRGVARDGVRLLAVTPNGVSHHRFRDLPELLEPGDLVVVNTSATLPAALTGHHHDGRPALVHVSSGLDDSEWIVEIRSHNNSGPDLAMTATDVIHLPGRVTLTLSRPHPEDRATRSRLWTAGVTPPTPLVGYLAKHGRPIVYAHLAAGLPLSEHQTVYADQPGSAEMPSAGRPFTSQLLVRLMAAGITVAPLTLHAGVSSPESHEPPAPEQYSVPTGTARLVSATRAAGKRVVAVGTTVVRAIETVAEDGVIRGGSGWTNLVLGPDRPARAVTGLITGLHLPESSHLLLLEAVVDPRLVEQAYVAAVGGRYLWHEFGDSMLFLP